MNLPYDVYTSRRNSSEILVTSRCFFHSFGAPLGRDDGAIFSAMEGLQNATVHSEFDVVPWQPEKWKMKNDHLKSKEKRCFFFKDPFSTSRIGKKSCCVLLFLSVRILHVASQPATSWCRFRDKGSWSDYAGTDLEGWDFHINFSPLYFPEYILRDITFWVTWKIGSKKWIGKSGPSAAWLF